MSFDIIKVKINPRVRDMKIKTSITATFLLSLKRSMNIFIIGSRNSEKIKAIINGRTNRAIFEAINIPVSTVKVISEVFLILYIIFSFIIVIII